MANKLGFFILCFIIVLLIHNISTTTSNNALTLSSENVSLTDNINFIFFPPGRNTSAGTFSYKDSLSVLKHPLFNPSKRTVLYHHGFNENCSISQPAKSCIQIIKGFQSKAEVNLIMVNYANNVYNERPYNPDTIAEDAYDAAVNVKNMGPDMCNFYKNFFEQCNCTKHTDLIGFSIGSQVIHNGAKDCSFKPYSVISLDAANHPVFRDDSINANDAKYVQAIHTNGAFLGVNASHGSIDFYVNGGQRQYEICTPGSEIMALYDNNIETCSHYTVVIYLMNTVAQRDVYRGINCRSCSKRPTLRSMGYLGESRFHGDICVNITSIDKLY